MLSIAVYLKSNLSNNAVKYEAHTARKSYSIKKAVTICQCSKFFFINIPLIKRNLYPRYSVYGTLLQKTCQYCLGVLLIYK